MGGDEGLLLDAIGVYPGPGVLLEEDDVPELALGAQLGEILLERYGGDGQAQGDLHEEDYHDVDRNPAVADGEGLLLHNRGGEQRSRERGDGAHGPLPAQEGVAYGEADGGDADYGDEHGEHGAPLGEELPEAYLRGHVHDAQRYDHGRLHSGEAGYLGHVRGDEAGVHQYEEDDKRRVDRGHIGLGLIGNPVAEGEEEGNEGEGCHCRPDIHQLTSSSLPARG